MALLRDASFFGLDVKISFQGRVTSKLPIAQTPLITVWAGNRRLDLNKVQLNLAIVRLLRST